MSLPCRRVRRWSSSPEEVDDGYPDSLAAGDGEPCFDMYNLPKRRCVYRVGNQITHHLFEALRIYENLSNLAAQGNI